MEDKAVTLALIAILATVVTGLFKLLNDNTKAIKLMADNSGRQTLELSKQTLQLGQQTVAIKQQSKESRERNGHLGDQNIEIVKLVIDSNKKQLEAIHNLPKQHIDNQVVDNQTVNNTTKAKK